MSDPKKCELCGVTEEDGFDIYLKNTLWICPDCDDKQSCNNCKDPKPQEDLIQCAKCEEYFCIGCISDPAFSTGSVDFCKSCYGKAVEAFNNSIGFKILW